MRKYLTILSVCILILPIINVIPSKPIVKNDSVTTSNDIINGSTISQIEEQYILQNLNNLDGFFTENRGQVSNNSVKYYIQGKGVWFLDDGVLFKIRKEISIDSRESRVGSQESDFPFDPMARRKPPGSPKYKSVVLKLNFEGANRIIPEGCGLLSHRSNFFYGNVSSKWCTNVPNFQEIIYENLYDNIDLKYYTTSNGLKYDFIVHPGGEPDDIRVRYKGVKEMYINSAGNLILHTQLGNIIDSNLLIYQNNGVVNNVIKGKFKMLTSMTYCFKLFDEYDKNKDLIIDPLIYSTFFGGNGEDWGLDISIGFDNSIYVIGSTQSVDFPNTTGAYDILFNGNQDVVMLKLSLTGLSLIYSTFLGGSDMEYGYAIELDTSGSSYATGYTKSANFPNTTGVHDSTFNGEADVFVFKLNSTGSSLLYSTFIGGTSHDFGDDIVIDLKGYTYVTGVTHSPDFPNKTGVYDPTFNGGADAFVFKLNPTGSLLLYSTFVGGNKWDNSDNIALDNSENVYVTGWTDSPDFPNTTGSFDNTSNGGYDVFVFKLNSFGSSLIYSTFIGGIKDDWGCDIAIDSNGNAYITGYTRSLNFPNTTDAYDHTYNDKDGFVLKLDSKGSSLLYSTFFGGNGRDFGFSIIIDSKGNTYVTGRTNSNDFPITTNAYDTTYNNKYDIFVLKLNWNGSILKYSSFVGGSNDDSGFGIAIDSNANLYVTGFTESSNFPITTLTYDNTHNGDLDVFIVKLNLSINNLSSVLDFKISESTVLRTKAIHLYSNATDIEDIEKNLTPFFEYEDPNELIWNSTYFSNPQYNNLYWEVTFTPPRNAILGLYDFRVCFNDTGLLFSNWFYLNDSLTVLNNIPFVKNLFLSTNKALFGDNISIWINGTDVEDSEENLTTELEYKDHNEQSWNTTYLNIPKFINNRWKNNFTIPFNAYFGYYDFRVRFNDSDGDYSQWFYSNDSLLIYNIRPKVIDIELSEYSICRTNSAFLFINGTDHETEESMLTFYAQYRPDGMTEWTDLTGEYNNLNDRWETKFNTNKESILGVYDFRIKFMDNESTSSSWQYLNDSLEVLNNLPIISEDLDDIEVGIQPKFIDLTQYESDIEDTNVDLIWNVNKTKIYDYIESISIIDPNNDTLKIVPLKNITGDIDIALTLTDKDGGTSTKSDVTVHIDSRITDLTPKVTLLFPPDEAIVNTLTPKLEWSLDYSGNEIITYSVYLDKKPNPETIIKSNITTKLYTLEYELEDGKTYYWNVIPSGGVCLSNPFSFTIDLRFKPIYKVNLTTEKNYIMINQGSSTEVNLTVINEGNAKDNFRIEYNFGKLQSLININKTNIQLPPGIKSTLKFKISIPENFELGEYSILVTAASLSDETVSDEVTIIIKVVGKDFIPIYGVVISVLPNSIEIVQGKSENVTLKITNVGNLVDEYNISFMSNEFPTRNIVLSNSTLCLLEGSMAQINALITVPDDIKPGKYKLEFIAKSDMASNNTSLAINVKEVGNDIKKEDNIMISVGIWIILIIIIILIFIIVVMKRKKISKHESPSKETIGNVSPAQEKTLEEDSAVPTLAQPSVETAAQPPTMAALGPTITKTNQISQAPNLKQIPTVVQQPQLTPATKPTQTPTSGFDKSISVSPKIPTSHVHVTPKQPELPADGTTLAAPDSPSQTKPKDDVTPSPTVAKLVDHTPILSVSAFEITPTKLKSSPQAVNKE